MINVNEEMAKLVMRYNENQKHVVALRENLRGMFSQAGSLQAAVESEWLDFNVSGSMYLLEGCSKGVPHNFMNELPERMKELQDALLKEQSLKKALTKAGLDGIIK